MTILFYSFEKAGKREDFLMYSISVLHLPLKFMLMIQKHSYWKHLRLVLLFVSQESLLNQTHPVILPLHLPVHLPKIMYGHTC